jgi:hypothetical protein
VFGARVVCVWVRARAAAGSAWLQLSSRTRGRLVIAVFHGGGCLRRILLDDAPRGEPVRCSCNKADPLLKYLERALAESTAAPSSAKCLLVLTLHKRACAVEAAVCGYIAMFHHVWCSSSLSDRRQQPLGHQRARCLAQSKTRLHR